MWQNLRSSSMPIALSMARLDPSARGLGVATSLLRHAEDFARSTGAERLTLATAHDNLTAQHIYKKLGYVREDHFWYFHRLLP